MADLLPTIEVKPALASKINLVQLLALALQGIDWLVSYLNSSPGFIPPKWQPVLIAAQSVITILLRVFASGTPIKGFV